MAIYLKIKNSGKRMIKFGIGGAFGVQPVHSH